MLMNKCQPINNDIKTYKNIRKIAISQGDDYTTGCFLDYPYFKKNYKMIAIDLSKQQALHYWRSKRNCLRLFTRDCKSIVNVL